MAEKITRRVAAVQKNGEPIYAYYNSQGQQIQPNWSGQNYMVEDSEEGKIYNYSKFGGFDAGQSIEDYAKAQNAGPEKTIDATYKQGYIQKSPDGKYYKWDQTSGGWKPASAQEVAYATNPSAASASNLSVLDPTTPLDNPIPPYIQLGVVDPVTGENSWEKSRREAEREAANPTGMDAQKEAIEAIKKTIGASATEKIIQDQIAKLLTGTGREDYANSVYNTMASKLNAAAQIEREQNAADLAARGLGMSTVVNDVNSVTNRNLMNSLQTSASEAATQAANYIRDMINSGVTMENNIGTRTQSAGQNLSGVGTNMANIYANAQNRLQAVNDQKAANDLLNLGLQNQAWDKKAENMKWLLNFPYATNAAGNNSQNAGVSASNASFNGALDAYAKKQQDIGTLFSGFLTNAFGKKS